MATSTSSPEFPEPIGHTSPTVHNLGQFAVHFSCSIFPSHELISGWNTRFDIKTLAGRRATDPREGAVWDQGDWNRSIPCTSSDWLLVVCGYQGSHLSKRWININTYSNQDPLGRQIYFPPDDLNIFQTRWVRNSKILLYTNVMMRESYLLPKQVAYMFLISSGRWTQYCRNYFERPFSCSSEMHGSIKNHV